MEQLKERIEKLERRQEAILNATRWDRFPLEIRNELAEEKREKMEENPELKKKSRKQIEREKEREREKEKEKGREERENLDDFQQMVFDAKTELEDLYKKGIVSHEEALCRYVMIGTTYWYKDASKYLNASLSEREKINMEKERFEMVNRKIVEKGREKEFNLLARQQRIQELEAGTSLFKL